MPRSRRTPQGQGDWRIAALAAVRHGAQPAYAARAKGTGASQHWSAARHGAQSAHAARAVPRGERLCRSGPFRAGDAVDAGERICRREGPFSRTRDAFICLPSVLHALLPTRNYPPCARRSHLFAVRPARAPPCAQFSPVRAGRSHLLAARSARAPSCTQFLPVRAGRFRLLATRPAAPPCTQFLPVRRTLHLLAARPARAPSCTQFLPVRRTLPSACRPPGPRASLHAIFARARRTHFAPARFEPHGNGGAPARRAQRREKDAWHGGRIGSPVEAVTHSSTKLNKSSFPHLGV